VKVFCLPGQQDSPARGNYSCAVALSRERPEDRTNQPAPADCVRFRPPDRTTMANASTLAVNWPQALAQHDRWLRTVVMSRLGEPQAVEEVMQEVALAAVKQRAPLADASRVAPWLYRLAVIQSLLYRRKQGRRRKLTERFAYRNRPVESESRTVDPLEWLMAGEERQMVRQALARLPNRDQEILLLKYTEDWSYHQLAAHLGVSHSAVEARLHRARQRLRNELAAMNMVEMGP
jgi:RNA polymerase sigma factor (sigma-70 family)